MKNETLEGNKLLAEFMGKTPVHTSYMSVNTEYWGDLKYRSDWNWLMPVCEKIEKECNQWVIINGMSCEIKDGHRNTEFVSEISKIHAVWSACVEFVRWYNQQKGEQK